MQETTSFDSLRHEALFLYACTTKQNNRDKLIITNTVYYWENIQLDQLLSITQEGDWVVDPNLSIPTPSMLLGIKSEIKTQEFMSEFFQNLSIPLVFVSNSWCEFFVNKYSRTRKQKSEWNKTVDKLVSQAPATLIAKNIHVSSLKFCFELSPHFPNTSSPGTVPKRFVPAKLVPSDSSTNVSTTTWARVALCFSFNKVVEIHRENWTKHRNTIKTVT